MVGKVKCNIAGVRNCNYKVEGFYFACISDRRRPVENPCDEDPQRDKSAFWNRITLRIVMEGKDENPFSTN